jgi:hypothetical protein
MVILERGLELFSLQYFLFLIYSVRKMVILERGLEHFIHHPSEGAEAGKNNGHPRKGIAPDGGGSDGPITAVW